MSITIIRAVIIYIAVIVSVRIMGKRQLGEMEPHEFVITILISAVATVPLEDNAIPLTNSLLPILVLVSLEIIASAVSMKSQGFRTLLSGKPVFIIKDGKLNQSEMKRTRLTVDDILNGLRQQKIFDIENVQNAVVEANGKLSVQEKAADAVIPIPIVLDGKAVKEYFAKEEYSEQEIDVIVSSANCKLEEMLLLTLDENGNTNIIKKEN